MEVLSTSRAHVFAFLVKLFILSVLVSGIFKTYYIIDAERGISKPLAIMFSGMEIKEGVLIPNRPVPYVPPRNLVRIVYDRTVGLNFMGANFPDTFLVVDTENTSWEGNRKPSILMNKNSVVFMPYTESQIEFPYELIMNGVENFSFEPEETRSLLTGKIRVLFFNQVILSGVFSLIMIITSVFFLGIAAFLFRLDKSRALRGYLKIACYACSPVVVGNIMMVASGVKIDWVWHVFIFISSIIMFRAMVAIQRTESENRDKNVEQ
ncbi:hypothetical protein CHISP_1449 [Chitinispirillum alkaliphilum]|nr:hypothetical protein CHISP_1449 [Chitinispirillum alkaliphilum]